MSLLQTPIQNLGLSESELELYELLLKTGEVPIAQILNESKLKRPTLYKALYSLEKLGLVTQRDFQKKIHFKPEPPTKLYELVNSHYEKLERTRNDLGSIIPQLTSLYIQSVERPIVQIYEGVEGLKDIYKDILTEGEGGFTVLQIEDMDPELEEWVTTKFLRGRLRKKMFLQSIIMDGPTAKKFVKRDSAELRMTRIVPKEQFPFQHEVTVYGDKVAFIHYKKGDQLIGMVVKHPQFAQTMGALCKLAWEGAKSYKMD
jgi:sugar-specific transcriptional regulator TrmB